MRRASTCFRSIGAEQARPGVIAYFETVGVVTLPKLDLPREQAVTCAGRVPASHVLVR
jgi:hypothetical protein